MSRFIKIASLKALEARSPLCIEMEGKRIALFYLSGRVHALDDVCTHEGGPLSEGVVEGDEVECPWHGARFRITTGELLRPPAYENVRRYNVRVSGDDIEVEV